MPEDMSDRMPEDMPEDLPVRKCINVMVGITRSKVISIAIFFIVRKSPLWDWRVMDSEDPTSSHHKSVKSDYNSIPLPSGKHINIYTKSY